MSLIASEQTFDASGFALGEVARLTKFLLLILGLVLEAVTEICMLELHFTCFGKRKALRSSAMSLVFRHDSLSRQATRTPAINATS